MKKIITSLLLLVAVMASAQEVPSSFPRKFLIEHFTGDGCGNCPGGMAAMVEYIQNTATPCIWVSHHYGYNEDEYLIMSITYKNGICKDYSFHSPKWLYGIVEYNTK